jgi:chaperone modulatory protein CbpM
MSKNQLVIIAEPIAAPLTLEELCELLQVDTAMINTLIEFEIIHPEVDARQQWLFDEIQLHRVQTALRLQHDLEVNLAGVALVLDLLEELKVLRTRAEFLEKHVLK